MSPSEYATSTKKPARNLRLSPFMMDVVFTAVTAVATTTSLVLVLRFLAIGLGPEDFGVYSIARRVFTTLIPCSTLAMNQTVARYMATTENPQERFAIFMAGLILSLAATLLTIVICWPVQSALSLIIFQDSKYAGIIGAILFMLLGNAFYVVLYGFYRGSGSMSKANAWQLFSYAIGPILIAALLSRSGRVDIVLVAMGSLYLMAVLPICYYVFKGRRFGRNLILRVRLVELLRYGSGRAVGGLILASIFACGPFMAPYFGSLKDAGFLAIGQSVFSLSEAGVVAFGLVVLPKAAQLVASGRQDFLRQRIGDILSLVLHLGLFLTTQLIIWAELIVRVWLGTQYLEAVPIMRTLLVAVTPYLAYTLLRSVIDAVEERAVNALNLLIALLANLVVSVLFANSFGVLGIAIGTVIGFIVLGAATLRYLSRTGWVISPNILLLQCVALNAVAVAVALLLQEIISTRLMLPSGYQLGAGVLLVCSLFLSYCYALHKLKATWVEQIAIRILPSAK